MKKSYIIGSVLAGMIAFGASFATSYAYMVPRRAVSNLDLGKKYIKEGNYDEALIAVLRAISIDPKNIEAYEELAEIAEVTGAAESIVEILKEGYERTGDEGLGKLARKIEKIAVSQGEDQEAGEADREDAPGNDTASGDYGLTEYQRASYDLYLDYLYKAINSTPGVESDARLDYLYFAASRPEVESNAYTNAYISDGSDVVYGSWLYGKNDSFTDTRPVSERACFSLLDLNGDGKEEFLTFANMEWVADFYYVPSDTMTLEYGGIVDGYNMQDSLLIDPKGMGAVIIEFDGSSTRIIKSYSTQLSETEESGYCYRDENNNDYPMEEVYESFDTDLKLQYINPENLKKVFGKEYIENEHPEFEEFFKKVEAGTAFPENNISIERVYSDGGKLNVQYKSNGDHHTTSVEKLYPEHAFEDWYLQGDIDGDGKDEFVFGSLVWGNTVSDVYSIYEIYKLEDGSFIKLGDFGGDAPGEGDDPRIEDGKVFCTGYYKEDGVLYTKKETLTIENGEVVVR